MTEKFDDLEFGHCKSRTIQGMDLKLPYVVKSLRLKCKQRNKQTKHTHKKTPPKKTHPNKKIVSPDNFLNFLPLYLENFAYILFSRSDLFSHSERSSYYKVLDKTYKLYSSILLIWLFMYIQLFH